MLMNKVNGQRESWNTERGRELVIYICSGGVFHVKARVDGNSEKHLQLLYHPTFFKRPEVTFVKTLSEKYIRKVLSKHFKHSRPFLCEFSKSCKY